VAAPPPPPPPPCSASKVVSPGPAASESEGWTRPRREAASEGVAVDRSSAKRRRSKRGREEQGAASASRRRRCRPVAAAAAAISSARSLAPPRARARAPLCVTCVQLGCARAPAVVKAAVGARLPESRRRGGRGRAHPLSGGGKAGGSRGRDEGSSRGLVGRLSPSPKRKGGGGHDAIVRRCLAWLCALCGRACGEGREFWVREEGGGGTRHSVAEPHGRRPLAARFFSDAGKTRARAPAQRLPFTRSRTTVSDRE
jgi:hypothetical protein